MRELDLLLLGVLRDGPAHGYAIITALRERSDGVFDYAEGTIYPALHRLEDGRLVSSRSVTEGGRRRRVYAITAAGKRSFAEQRESWLGSVRAMQAVIA